MSKRKRLVWQIFPPMLVVTMIAVMGTFFLASKITRQFYIEQITTNLKVRARLVRSDIQADFRAGQGDLQRRSRQMAVLSQARVTLIKANGEVRADSDKNPADMDNHAHRPEVAIALTGNPGTSMRFSHTLGKNMIYVALPVFTTDNRLSPVFGVVRLAIPFIFVNQVLDMMYWQNFFAAFIMLVIAAIVTLFVSRKLSKPLEDMGRTARQYSRLDFSHKINFPDGGYSIEVAELADTINSMAMELYRRIDTVTKQKNELEAVFKSMIEGVLVVDNRGRLVRANDTALKIFNLPSNYHPGAITESIRNVDLSRFIREILSGGYVREQDLVLYLAGGERHFHLSGTPIRDGSNKTGAMVVLNDITRTKKLENIRREFVANVSHELKTPITSINGFVETLLDGALENSLEAKHFLEIIHRQARRLDAIINDLLKLSRIEREDDMGAVELHHQDLLPVLNNCLEMCAVAAREKGIKLILDGGPGITALINQNLMEQAVTNLVVNAIKYSSEGGEVRIKSWQDERQIQIAVSDNGCGIAREHLSRLFERFYRSDKARSRKLGGTGLGLAIVKHIVKAHGGEVKVKSRSGRGSTFTIILPDTPLRPIS
ncbi:MAG TPA: HAMP domain-containing histidine kinase [Desulfobacterales bacterium]|nr:HAMP domain-containing histidine kinase [Desulfobacterales bacterium]